MSQAAKAQEPSMEEILASIRRIIADDDAGKGKAPEPRRAAPAPQPAAPQPAKAATTPPPAMPSPVARKAEPKADPAPQPQPAQPAAKMPAAPTLVTAPPPPPAGGDVLDLTEAMAVTPAAPFRKIEPTHDLDFAETTPPPPAPEPPVAPPETAEAAQRPFQREPEDDRSLLSRNTTEAVDAAFSALAQTVLVQNTLTLDALVREMLRPMLKTWLDDNLPNMVERLVRAEIERVSRGR